MDCRWQWARSFVVCRWPAVRRLGAAVQVSSQQNVETSASAQTAPNPAAVAMECVQVPVTYYQTQYRTECRTEMVPVTRMVREVVDETRTVTVFHPQQEIVDKKIVRYVCEPATVMQRCYRPVPVTKNVERTLYQSYCTTEMTNKVITRYIPECVTETVPVTRMRKVVEPELCMVTQNVPVTTMVPVVTCTHQCGHRCSGGCGQCGGVTACVRYRPVTTCVQQQVQVTRPKVTYIPETTQVQRTRTKYNPVQETVCVPQVRVNRIPYKVTECITQITMEPYEVQVTKMVRKPVTETVQVCVTKMIPESSTVTVPTVKCRPVTDTVTRQVSVCVPYQVPVTVMTTQVRPVSQPVAGASAQTSATPQDGR